jgi:N-acetylglucosaminyl-diphospho-decaprenol L-rhamnosyltransferase
MNLPSEGKTLIKCSQQAAQEPISLFILHWNQPRLCLETIARFREQKVPTMITVVDNGSRPESRSELERFVPEGIRCISLGQNLGWGAGFNVALEKWLSAAPGEFCFISAHDAIPEPGCLDRLMEAFHSDQRLGIVSPQDGVDQLPFFSPLTGPRLIQVHPRPGGTVEPAAWVHGTLMGLRKACLKEIGLFDDRYFAYGDEQELCLRANRGGWKTAIVWDARVGNPGTSVPTPLLTYLQTRGTLLLASDYGGRLSSAARAVLIVVNTIRLFVIGKLDKNAAIARMRAVGDFLLDRFGKPPDNLSVKVC